jgi:hypothetical protein
VRLSRLLDPGRPAQARRLIEPASFDEIVGADLRQRRPALDAR